MFLSKFENNFYYVKLGNLSNDDFMNYISFFKNIFSKEEKFKIIFDLTNISFKDIRFSKKKLQFMIDNKENTRKYLIKSSIICNDFQLFLLNKFILRFYKPIKPNYITDKLNKAVFYINDDLL